MSNGCNVCCQKEYVARASVSPWDVCPFVKVAAKRIGFLLVSFWFPFSFLLVSFWFPFGFLLSLSSKGCPQKKTHPSGAKRLSFLLVSPLKPKKKCYIPFGSILSPAPFVAERMDIQCMNEIRHHLRNPGVMMPL